MKTISIFAFPVALSILLPISLSFIFQAFAVLAILLTIPKFVYSYNNNSRSADRGVVKRFSAFIGFVFLSYLVNVVYKTWFLASASDVIFSNSGLKLIAASCFIVIVLFLTYSIVSVSVIAEREKLNFMLLVVSSGGISAGFAIFEWLSKSGGAFARYNFIPPLSGSQGVHLYSMIISILFSIVLLRCRKNISHVGLAISATSFILCFFSIFTVIVREGWLVFALLLILSTFFFARGSLVLRVTKAAFIAIPLIFIIIFYFIQNNLFADLSLSLDSSSADSTFTRYTMIKSAFSIFIENLLFGVGLGNFPLYAPQVLTLASGGRVDVATPHNGILLIGSETGLLSLLSYLWLCCSLVLSSARRLSLSYGLVTRSMACVIFPLILVLALNQLTSNSLIIPPTNELRVFQLSYLIWISIAVLFAPSVTPCALDRQSVAFRH